MKYIFTAIFILFVSAAAGADGTAITYEVDGKPFEGYFISPSPKAPLILLIHDWDGLLIWGMRFLPLTCSVPE
jgi:hypothetical protein